MPTYEYRCPDGHEFERFYRKISDATAEVSCPTCGKTAERRMSKGGGLLFKGSGFYLTDYGKNAHRGEGAAAGKGDGKAGETGSAEATSKSESTPAVKPDAGTGSTSAGGGESKSSGASEAPASPKKATDKPPKPRKSDT